VLDKLGGVPRFLLWVETDRLSPPWDVRQDVFEAYVEDEDAETEDDEPVTPFADPPTGPFDRDDLAAWEWLHRTFAAVVTTLDAELGTVFDELRARGLDQTAGWLVTSDLGYPLGEHGQVGLHRPWLHEELVHLPLVLRFPAASEAGRRVPAFTQPADLFPTLLELLGAELPIEPVHGHSLIPLATGKAVSVREYACSGLVIDGAAEWAIRTPDWALLLPGPQPDGDPPREPQLYEKPDDRWEVNDLGPRSVELAEQLEDVLRKYLVAVQHPGPLVAPALEEMAR
jgi:arylsulfatase A-like enzyme